MSTDAFGVDRSDLVSKADFRPVKPFIEAGRHYGHGATRAGATNDGFRVGRDGARFHRKKKFTITDAPPGPTRRQEYSRGFVGGAMGGQTAAQGSTRATRKGLRGEYRNARNKAAASSPHERTFRAGAASGRVADSASRHPNTTIYGTSGVVIAGGVGAQVASDKRKAAKNVKRKDVSKGLVRTTLIAGAVGGAIGESNRRIANTQGANVSFKESNLHPLRSARKMTAAGQREWAKSAQKAQREYGKQARDTSRSPKKREYSRLQVERAKEAENRFHYNAQKHNARAVHGRRGAKASGAADKYDKSVRYRSPQEIGKSDAFGIARPDLVEKGIDEAAFAAGKMARPLKPAINGLKGAVTARPKLTAGIAGGLAGGGVLAATRQPKQGNGPGW